MFVLKKEYFFIIKNINDINLNLIKRYNKFNIIFRNSDDILDISVIIKFRNKCKLKKIKFFVANNARLAVALKADGIYLSSSNNNFRYLSFLNLGFCLIGGAHNFKEIYQKMKQGCQKIIVSKLFKVAAKPGGKIYNVIKFNNLQFFYKNIIPLGGIKLGNINKLKIVNSNAFTIMSEIKKKPAISSRLF
ncbi:thiamine phosphate synthase [Pelagibacteraceae bacterium]|nr:thiamine phosphate synthase [Pelagibacteraceae bacterium]